MKTDHETTPWSGWKAATLPLQKTLWKLMKFNQVEGCSLLPLIRWKPSKNHPKVWKFGVWNGTKEDWISSHHSSLMRRNILAFSLLQWGVFTWTSDESNTIFGGYQRVETSVANGAARSHEPLSRAAILGHLSWQIGSWLRAAQSRSGHALSCLKLRGARWI
jgi:hypothetical protein